MTTMNSMRKDLDAAMANVVLGEARRAAILTAMEKGEKPVKKVIRPMVVLAAALLLLTASAFALVPSLREALETMLGGFAPYTQTVEGVKAEDQGIEIEVLSALSDATTAKVYLSVRDKTGSRIENGDIRLGGHIRRVDADDNLYTTGIWSMGYDDETGAALFEAVCEGSAPVAAGGTAQLKITSVQPGYHRVQTDPPPQSLLTGRILKTQVLPTGETVLTPGQTEYTYEGTDYLSLSSMGFGADGRFHMLWALSDGVDMEKSHLLTTLYSKTLEDSEPYNREIRTLGFTLGGKNYYEFSVRLDVDVWEDLRLYGAYGTIIDQAAIEGEWELSVDLEQAPQRRFAMNENISCITYRGMTLSCFAITISGNPPSDGKIGMIPYFMPVAVVMDDGTVIHLKTGSGSYSNLAEGDRYVGRWIFENAVDVEQIAGVAIGQWMIPIAGDTAGPGYWLSELPE